METHKKKDGVNVQVKGMLVWGYPLSLFALDLQTAAHAS
jgi:hypothetical protein